MMLLSRFLNKKQKIRVNVKLLAGLDLIEGYDSRLGIDLEVDDGIRLKKAIKKVHLPQEQPIFYIVNGTKVGVDVRLKDGDEIFCFLPLAGG